MCRKKILKLYNLVFHQKRKNFLVIKMIKYFKIINAFLIVIYKNYRNLLIMIVLLMTNKLI